MGYVQFGAGQGSSTDRALRCYGGDDFETYYSNFIVITNAPNSCPFELIDGPFNMSSYPFHSTLGCLVCYPDHLRKALLLIPFFSSPIPLLRTSLSTLGTLGYRVTVMARSINPAHRVRCLLPPRDQPILQPYISIRRYSQHSTILGHNITYISPSMDEVTPSIVSSLGAHTFTILGMYRSYPTPLPPLPSSSPCFLYPSFLPFLCLLGFMLTHLLHRLCVLPSSLIGNGLDFAGDLYRFETRLAAYNDVATGWTCGVIESFYTNITLTCPIIFPEIPHIIILMSSASSLTISTPPIVAPALTGYVTLSFDPIHNCSS